MNQRIDHIILSYYSDMETFDHLTKSDFLRFLDAPMHLWAARHDHIETSLSPFDMHLIDQGYQAEQLAREYIQANLLNAQNGDILHWQETYSYDEFTIRTDALVEKTGPNTFDLYEIKSGTSVKPENILDAAFQFFILEKLLSIDRVFILHLNKEYVRQGALQTGSLFTAEDITGLVSEKMGQVKSILPAVLETARSETMQNIPHCLSPKTCPCPSICHPNLPEHSIYDIPRLSAHKKNDLIAQGILSIRDIPASFNLNEKQSRIVDVVRSNAEYIDQAAIKAQFDGFIFPLYFLDYETCLTAIPQFNGYHPQQQMVFQYSLHKIETPQGALTHTEYLADTKSDPSIELVRKLRADMGDMGTVFVWNKSFEMTRNKEMAFIHPEFEPFLSALDQRVYDLGDFVSQGLYLHPDFKGSWSIKNVLPVMVPDLTYDHLDVNKGDQAMAVWWRMVNDHLSEIEKEKIKASLLAYCKMDTLAMVRIWGKLRQMC
jgi:hypothetical protein